MRNIDLGELILKSLSGNASDADLQKLSDAILNNSKAMEYYKDYINLYACLATPGSSADFIHEEDIVNGGSAVSLRGVEISQLGIKDSVDESEDQGLTQAMLEVLELERSSPAVDTRQGEPQRILIQNVESNFKLISGSPSKFTLRTLFALAACLIVVIGYLHFFVPTQFDHPVVATLADSMEVVWDSELQMPDEFGYMVQSRYGLKEGYASILFNDGAKVTVEAPAELSLNSSGDMELFRGRIYAIVPERAKGFAVKAASSKIVDLGTEFGVEVGKTGNTQLHVTRGRTVLFAGLLSDKKQQISVDAGVAKKVYNDGFVKDIPVAKQKFARIINSKSNLVIRDPKFNLADVVGGGNGFGTGTLEKGIDMVSARFQQVFEGKNYDPFRVDDFSYKLFAEHPYIDGVCVPNGSEGPVKVTSRGDIFENCPLSSGLIGAGPFNGAFHYSEPRGISKTQASLGGITYGTVTNPAIYIPPSQAVTFDLDAIRKNLDGLSISSFTSKAGLSEAVLKCSQGLNPKTSFYVLVDGVVRFSKIDQQVTDDVLDIRVDIEPNDRFLTIMTLQGTDGRTGLEWSLFAEPSLDLE